MSFLLFLYIFLQFENVTKFEKKALYIVINDSQLMSHKLWLIRLILQPMSHIIMSQHI